VSPHRQASRRRGIERQIAPRELTGHEGEEQTRAHLQLLRLAQQLTADLGDCGVLTVALAEGEDIGRAFVLLVLNPAPDVYIGAVDEALRSSTPASRAPAEIGTDCS
jgi:hypothetical protein